jgi:tRNA pseudouridine38-40 synthase
MVRLALGVSYRGTRYLGWQSQPGGQTVQDQLELALSTFADHPVTTACAGRTDAGVHGFNQVVHLDTALDRREFSWVRGTNRFLPSDIAVEWCQPVADEFHARFLARGRRYSYVLRESVVRPSLDSDQVGWVFRPLDGARMQAAVAPLLGEHDFSAFRAAACQAKSPIKTLRAITIRQRGAYWRFDFDASAFLHHMVRNLMGCLITVGQGTQPPEWVAEVLASRNRDCAAPTFSPDGLYFVGPYYDAVHALPEHTPGMDWLP